LQGVFAAIPSLAQMTPQSGIGSLSITLQFDLDRPLLIGPVKRCTDPRDRRLL
jgi:hypothetical protein